MTINVEIWQAGWITYCSHCGCPMPHDDETKEECDREKAREAREKSQ
jgi:hypothetical protein